jgi:ketosteroid isomerase-like protein
MSQETLAGLRRGYEGFNRGDPTAAIELATPDVEWGTTGSFPGLSGVYRGPEAIREWTEAVRSAWEEFNVSLDELIYDGDDVLVVAERLRGRGRGSGAEVEMVVYAVYSFIEGRVRKRQAFTERAAALAAAGIEP